MKDTSVEVQKQRTGTIWSWIGCFLPIVSRSCLCREEFTIPIPVQVFCCAVWPAIKELVLVTESYHSGGCTFAMMSSHSASLQSLARLISFYRCRCIRELLPLYANCKIALICC